MSVFKLSLKRQECDRRLFTAQSSNSSSSIFFYLPDKVDPFDYTVDTQSLCLQLCHIISVMHSQFTGFANQGCVDQIFAGNLLIHFL